MNKTLSSGTRSSISQKKIDSFLKSQTFFQGLIKVSLPQKRLKMPAKTVIFTAARKFD